jgi:ADP-ribose pyrophosphatase YjhB (NUDIX family)
MSLDALVILAGGTNQRLRPLSDTAYKAFLPIHGASIAARQILQAHFAGIEHVCLAIDAPDPLAEQVAADSPGDVTCLVAPGSTAEKVLAVHALHPDWRSLALALGDTFAKVDFQGLARAAATDDVDSVVCLAPLRVPLGVVQVAGRRVVNFSEKPLLTGLVNSGYMLLGEAGIAALAETRDLARTLEKLVSDRELGYVIASTEATSTDTLPLMADAHLRLAGEDISVAQSAADPPGAYGGVEPRKLSASLVIRDDAERVLVVRRPEDPEDDIAGLWGFPATSALTGESEQDVAARVGLLKLGVQVRLGRRIGASTRQRRGAQLTMVDYEASIVDGTPAVPQSDRSVTQYTEMMFTEDPMVVLAAARAGSQCTQLFLDDLGVAWR